MTDPSDENFQRPAEVNRAFFGRLPRPHEVANANGAVGATVDPAKNATELTTTTASTTTTIGHDVHGEEGYTALFGKVPLKNSKTPKIILL